MKIFGDNDLFKNPIGWAQNLAGVRFRFSVFIFLHVLFGAMTVYKFIRGTLSLESLLLLVIVFVVILPFFYLYALRKLVLELKKREKTPEAKDE